jgi:threonine/homoserine/homoserine lactone efflux protein
MVFSIAVWLAIIMFAISVFSLICDILFKDKNKVEIVISIIGIIFLSYLGISLMTDVHQIIAILRG